MTVNVYQRPEFITTQKTTGLALTKPASKGPSYNDKESRGWFINSVLSAKCSEFSV